MLVTSLSDKNNVSLSSITSYVSSLTKMIVVFLISFYQRFLSPLKGFSCAYRVYHDSPSCSAYVKQVFLEQDFKVAIAMANQRFDECEKANRLLQAQNEKVEDTTLDKPIKRRKLLKVLSFYPFSFPILAKSGSSGSCNGCGNSISSCFGSSNSDNNDRYDRSK
jgi:putative component of membrane protein insertase Oxa1/YidC/SpoIIIJ protein YidD